MMTLAWHQIRTEKTVIKQISSSGYFSLIYYLSNEFLQGKGEVTACFLQTYVKAL